MKKIVAASERSIEPLPVDAALQDLIDLGHHEAVVSYILERIEEGEYDNRLYLYQLARSFWALGRAEEAYLACEDAVAHHGDDPCFWEHHLLLALREAGSQNNDAVINAVYHASRSVTLLEGMSGHAALEFTLVGGTPIHTWAHDLETRMMTFIYKALESSLETDFGSVLDKYYPILEQEVGAAMDREDAAAAIAIQSTLVRIMMQKKRFSYLRKVVESLIGIYLSVSDTVSASHLLKDTVIYAKLGSHARRLEKKIRESGRNAPAPAISTGSAWDRAPRCMAAGDGAGVIEKGAALIRTHDYGEAITHLSRLKRRPGLSELEEDEIVAQLAFAKLVHENRANARQVIDQAMAKRRTPLLFIALAQCQLHSHQFQEAKESLDAMADLLRNASPLLREKTAASLNTLFHAVFPTRSMLTDGEVLALIDFCRHAAARGCTGPDIRMNEAVAASFLGPEERARAVALAQAVVNDFPSSYLGHWALAEIYRQSGNLAQAEGYFEKAYELRGSFRYMGRHYVSFLYAFSHSLSEQGHHVKVVAVSKRMLELGEKSNPSVFSALVLSTFFLGQYAESIASAEEGLRYCTAATRGLRVGGTGSSQAEDKNFVDRFTMTFYSALSYYHLGNLQEARRLFDKYMKSVTAPPERVRISGYLVMVHTLVGLAARMTSGSRQTEYTDSLLRRLEAAEREFAKLTGSDRNIFVTADLVRGTKILSALVNDLRSCPGSWPVGALEKVTGLARLLTQISTRWDVAHAAAEYQSISARIDSGGSSPPS